MRLIAYYQVEVITENFLRLRNSFKRLICRENDLQAGFRIILPEPLNDFINVGGSGQSQINILLGIFATTFACSYIGANANRIKRQIGKS